MQIKPFFHQDTATVSYIVSDTGTKRCAIIDPVLDYNDKTNQTSTAFAAQLLAYIKEHGLQVDWILETHIHADHLTAAPYLKENLGAKIGIGRNITDVLNHWVPELKIDGTPLDGSQFDVLFNDGERFSIGNLKVTVLHTPGHTPACVSYLIGDAVFVGDTLFMPDVGTARTDFPGGSAQTLYRSIHKILALPDATRIFTAHDYPPDGRQVMWESTVGEQKKKNFLIHDGVSEADYIRTRNERDVGKPPPRLLMPSLRYNLRAKR